MPTFDFLCTACDNVFEFQRPFGSDTIPKCPACGSKKTEKQIAPPVIQFKGTGFYKTDSRGAQKSVSLNEKDSKDKKDSKDSKEPPTINKTVKTDPATKT